MSWSQRFMEKKVANGGAAAEWRSTEAAADGAAAGAGGGNEWRTVSRYQGAGTWKPKAKAEAPKSVLNMDSEEQFPTLGKAKPRPTAEQARMQGFAALAASWANQDAAEAAEAKRLRDEAQAAAEKRAKEQAQYGVLASIMRRRAEQTVSRDYEGEAVGSHSPAYPPYDEEPEGEAEPEEEPGSNPMFAYNAEEEEGWMTR